MSGLKVAIIGGTGVYNQSLLDDEKEITVDTRFGRVTMKEGRYFDRTVYFLPRHGGGHSVPPHMVNYRANITALRKIGVDAVISTAAVGTLRSDMPPGGRILIDQFIDFTRNRHLTFFDGSDGLVVHTDFSEPYCPEVRSAALRAAAGLDQKLVDGGCYACCEGPRFETPAEIKMLKTLGADLVGMTNVPEVTLAREAGLCYATICLATNYAAGISETALTHEEVLEEMERGKPELDRLLAAVAKEILPGQSCSCSEAGKYFKAD